MATKADEAPPPLTSVAAGEPSDPVRDPEIRAAAAEAGAEEEEEEEEEEETREPKRRRTCPAALETLPSAAAWVDGDGDGDGDGSVSGGGGDGGDEDEAISFSFEARSFAPIETTPKFGSFNCSSAAAAAETATAAAAPILETPPPPPPPPEEEEEEADGVGAEGKEERGGAEGKIGNSQAGEG